MKNIVLLFLLFSFGGTVNAQYNFAVGVRSGGTSGITLKNNFSHSAVEGLIGFWDDGISVTALIEKRKMAFGVPNLQWYYGVGGHISVYGKDFNGKGGPAWYRHPLSDSDGEIGFGADGVVGFGYKIPKIPLAVSIDLKPNIEVVKGSDILYWIDPGVGLKLAF